MIEAETRDHQPRPAPLPEPARPRPIIPLLPYQQEDIDSSARFRWNCWSRQSGKSFTKSLRRLLRGLARRRTQVLLSAGERQSRELMLKVRQHCQALRIAGEWRERGSFGGLTMHRLEIVLPGNVRIIGLPANPQTARGFSGDVLLDEFAMHAEDRQIWAALFPTLLRGNGELDIASTPRGRQNMFYRLRDNPSFSTSTVTLPDAIRQGLAADADEVRRAMADDLLYRQEFLCEFLDEATTFLTHEQILACVDPALRPADTPAALIGEAREMFIGVDVGRLRDLTVVWVLARSGGALVTVGLFELAAAPFRVQGALLNDLLALRRVRRCAIDAGGLGMQLAEDLTQRFGSHRVEAVHFTTALKSQLAGGLRIAVENQRIRIPGDDRILRDWQSVERSLTETGHFRLAAPRREGSHADRFWAAALAVYAAETPTGRPEFTPGTPLRFHRRNEP